METSFPDRYNVLKRYLLIEFIIVIVLVSAAIGCEPKKQYTVEPVPVFSKVLLIDSSYTKVQVISTGYSKLLFCGKKDIFDAYSIIKFDTIPETFDSLFLRFVSDTITCELSFFVLEQQWYEDSVYKWGDIGSLFDTTNPIQVATMYPVPVDSPATDTNSLIFLGSSASLDESTINAIGNYGLAVHSNRFYDFMADSTELKIESDDTLAPSSIMCTEEAFIVKNPFQDTIIGDSLLVGRGISARTYIFIPRDSLPSYSQLNAIAKADMLFDITDSIPFNVRTTYSTPALILYREPYMLSDSLKFDLTQIFRNVSDGNVVLEIRAYEETEGINIEKLSDGEIRFIWVEFPR
ncbi:hypothetical protein JW879_04375 [candidate division WOR-3 bacterium]|nr:hypothetical protein [candidate division WOR-3 bacterium]